MIVGDEPLEYGSSQPSSILHFPWRQKVALAAPEPHEFQQLNPIAVEFEVEAITSMRE
jgi:hypothetical protein